MKNLKWYLIIAALAIGMICLGVGWYKSYQTAASFQQKDALVKDKILTGAKEIARAVKSSGAETVLLDITDNHTSNKNVNQTDIPGIVDTAALAIDILKKQLKEVTVINGQYSAEKLQLTAQLDSFRNLYYTYSGNGLDLRLTPPNAMSPVATADFMGRFGITIAKGDRSKWYTPWKSRNLMSVSSDSKYFKVDHVNYIGFDKEPLPFHFDIEPMAAYNKFAGASAGAGINLQVGRFVLRPNYQYYDKYKQFDWGGTATFKIPIF